MRLVFPCLFGLERSVADELMTLGASKEAVQLSDGQVTFQVPEVCEEDREALATWIGRCNLCLSTAERCQLELYQGECCDFDAFFDLVYRFPWERYLNFGGRIRVDGYSRQSDLFGVPALQRLCKEAIVRRLLEARGKQRGEHLEEDPEKGEVLVRFALVQDLASFRLEMSGASLHKRSYRLEGGEAPLKESLAAGLLHTLRWPGREEEGLVDLFCGSGTIAIEAARRYLHWVPGLDRSFAMEQWPYLPAEALEKERAYWRQQLEKRLEALRSSGAKPCIWASDYEAEAIQLSKRNARRAGVEEWICFEQLDARAVDWTAVQARLGKTQWLLLSNPPYGERLSDEEAVRALTKDLRKVFLERDGALKAGLRFALFTSSEELEEDLGYRADKRRKLYNGMISCTLYQYFRRGERLSLWEERRQHREARREKKFGLRGASSSRGQGRFKRERDSGFSFERKERKSR